MLDLALDLITTTGDDVQLDDFERKLFLNDRLSLGLDCF